MIYEKMKEWYTDGKGYERECKATKALQNWCNKGNIEIVYGRWERTVGDTFGLPYTSSSDFAAIWNTNVTAVLKDNLKYWFNGVAITADDKKFVAVFTEYDDKGNEVGEYDIIID